MDISIETFWRIYTSLLDENGEVTEVGDMYSGMYPRYRKVNFGESDESYLLESALYDTLKIVYVEGDEPGHYVPETGNIVMGE